MSCCDFVFLTRNPPFSPPNSLQRSDVGFQIQKACSLFFLLKVIISVYLIQISNGNHREVSVRNKHSIQTKETKTAVTATIRLRVDYYQIDIG